MRRRIRTKPRFWLLVILLMIVGFGLSCAVSQLRSMQISAELDALRAQKVTLINQVQALTEQLNYANTDAYVERIARDELNMIYPGEIRYIAN